MSKFKLVRCDSETSLSPIHEIREKVLFSPGEYDRQYPDDRNPNHHCFIFQFEDKSVGTVRLDFIKPHEVAIRLVAILPEYQRQKMGFKMLVAVEEYVREKGINKLVTNSAINAIKFYESLGFVSENWVDPSEGISQPTNPMVKRLKFCPRLVKATIADHPIIQNMARFYVYDLSRYCGFISDDWACPPDGLYSDVDLKNYFEESTRFAYLIKIGKELVGFVLLRHSISTSDDYWVMAEFFILAKFQGQGIAGEVAKQFWLMYPGKWEIPVIPENQKALSFWRNVINQFTNGQYTEEIRRIDYDSHQPQRYILRFDTNCA